MSEPVQSWLSEFCELYLLTVAVGTTDLWNLQGQLSLLPEFSETWLPDRLETFIEKSCLF